MTLDEFVDQVNMIRAKNGWTITFEFCGLIIIRVEDKESGKELGTTGAATLSGILEIFDIPFNKSPWV
jgi:hypothetical protein